MTDDLERLEALARQIQSWSIEARKGYSPSVAQLMVEAGDAILSRIQRVREAEAWREDASGKLIELAKAVVIAHEAGHAAGRAEALEEAAELIKDCVFGSLEPNGVRERLSRAIRALGEKAG